MMQPFNAGADVSRCLPRTAGIESRRPIACPSTTHGSTSSPTSYPHLVRTCAVAGVLNSCLTGSCYTSCPAITGAQPPLTRYAMQRKVFAELVSSTTPTVGATFNKCSYGKTKLT